MGALYRITGPQGKQYIGITMRDASEREYDHKTWGVRRGSGYLHRAMRKHGFEAFKMEVLVIADDWAYLCDLERKAIAALGTRAPAGYNATDGGDGVTGMDAETTEKHRANTSAGTAKAWAEGRMASRALTCANPEFKAAHRESTRQGVLRMYADPQRRAKTIAALTSDAKRESNRRATNALWADPETRKRMTEASNTPEARKRRAESIRAAWAKKKELKA